MPPSPADPLCGQCPLQHAWENAADPDLPVIQKAGQESVISTRGCVVCLPSACFSQFSRSRSGWLIWIRSTFQLRLFG